MTNNMDKSSALDELENNKSRETGTLKENTNGDKLTQAIGELGRWQIFLITIISIPCKTLSVWNLMGIIFFAPKTEYRCLSRLNSTDDILQNTCYSDCDRYEYITEFQDSIITEFGLICKRSWMISFTQMVFMFGVLIGSMVFGFFADRYGRRKAFLTATMLQLVLSLLLPLCPEYWSFTAVRFILGACTAGVMVVSFVILVEITGPSKRELVSTLYQLPLAMGEMLMAIIAYYLRSWRMFALGIGVPNLLFLLYICLVPESPRWLITMGRLEEASEIIKKGAKHNNRVIASTLDVAQTIAKDANVGDNKQSQTKVSYIDLITHPTLRIRNLCSCVCWFILGLSYYGGNQYIGQTSSNVFMTIILAGALQIPGILASGYLFKRFGRRSTVIGFLLINSISNGLLAMPDDWFYLKIVAGAVGVSCAGGAFTTIYPFTSELFPTVARNMAMGVSSTTSRVGSMIAPFVAGITFSTWLAPAIFAVAPLIAAGVCCCLPETKGKKLADTLEK